MKYVSRYNMAKKKKIILFSLFLSVIVLISMLCIRTHPLRQRIVTPNANLSTYSILNRLIIPKTEEKSSYMKHLEAAASYGWSPIESTTQLQQLISERKLVEVTERKGFTLATNMSHSAYYLTDEANRFLQELGEVYALHAGIGNTFTVTSLTRMVKRQKALMRTNVNAVSESSHSYGCSFDISYVRFNGQRGRNRKQEKILEDILLDYQTKNRILFIKEKNIPCFHVTVNRTSLWYEKLRFPLSVTLSAN